VVADVAEALDDDALALEAAVEAAARELGGVAEELADGVLDAAPGGLGAAADSALANRFAGDAG
jgi:hypothetical protein